MFEGLYNEIFVAVGTKKVALFFVKDFLKVPNKEEDIKSVFEFFSNPATTENKKGFDYF